MYPSTVFEQVNCTPFSYKIHDLILKNSETRKTVSCSKHPPRHVFKLANPNEMARRLYNNVNEQIWFKIDKIQIQLHLKYIEMILKTNPEMLRN